MKITSLEYDSRKVIGGSAFFAIKGADDDGLKYAGEAVRNGAVAVIADRYTDELKELRKDRDVNIVLVKDVRKAMAEIAARFYGRPQDSLFTIGVTGTKGKTTTAFMVQRILDYAGIKCGIISTVRYGWEENYKNSDSTTPQSADIFRIMRNMADKGCKAVVVEVSSQALMQSRVYGIEFDVAVFTNIYSDHIGVREHKSFEEYIYWKSELFKQAKVAIINNDDEFANYMTANSQAKQLITYSIDSENREADKTANFVAKNVIKKPASVSEMGIQYNLRGETVNLRLPGEFNISNSLAAMAVARLLGVDLRNAAAALADFEVRGRTEIVPVSDKFTVLVDYAHNGDSLAKLLKALRDYEPVRLIVVFGCGGERACERREGMAKAAAELADFSIVTSDNPRREEPMAIIEDITKTISSCGGRFTVVADRGEAIRLAIKNAGEGDMIVIAGKGHETYQLVGDKVKYFDDRAAALSVREEKRG